MTYAKACKTLNLHPLNSKRTNAQRAVNFLNTMVANAPLRYKAACNVLINY